MQAVALVVHHTRVWLATLRHLRCFVSWRNMPSNRRCFRPPGSVPPIWAVSGPQFEWAFAPIASRAGFRDGCVVGAAWSRPERERVRLRRWARFTQRAVRAAKIWRAFSPRCSHARPVSPPPAPLSGTCQDRDKERFERRGRGLGMGRDMCVGHRVVREAVVVVVPAAVRQAGSNLFSRKRWRSKRSLQRSRSSTAYLLATVGRF